jgi:hypothetical protein
MKNKKWLLVLLSFILVVGTVIGLASPAMAATTAVVTVTNTTQFLSITNNLSTYNFNATGAAHAGVLPSTTYYSNPASQIVAPSATVVDGECAFQITDASSVAIDVTFTASNMTSGDASTNGNTGTAGASSYGAYTYVSGIALTGKVVCPSSASAVGISNLGASSTKYWGLWLNEQTNAWTTVTPATFTLTATASAH